MMSSETISTLSCFSGTCALNVELEEYLPCHGPVERVLLHDYLPCHVLVKYVTNYMISYLSRCKWNPYCECEPEDYLLCHVPVECEQ